MKKALLVLSILILSLELKAQTDEYYDPQDRPQFYLGIGTGINTYTGLAGISADYIIDKKIFIQGGIGLSTWGWRRAVGLRYDQSYRNGFTFGINYINSSGVDDIPLELETSNGDTRELSMRLENSGAISFKAGYNWWSGERVVFNLNIGYAIALKNQPWTVKDGSSLSPTSQQVLQLIAPGGIVFGLGFSFGI